MHLVHPDKRTDLRAGEAFGEMQSIKSLAVVSNPDASAPRAVRDASKDKDGASQQAPECLAMTGNQAPGHSETAAEVEGV